MHPLALPTRQQEILPAYGYASEGMVDELLRM